MWPFLSLPFYLFMKWNNVHPVWLLEISSITYWYVIVNQQLCEYFMHMHISLYFVWSPWKSSAHSKWRANKLQVQHTSLLVLHMQAYDKVDYKHLISAWSPLCPMVKYKSYDGFSLFTMLLQRLYYYFYLLPVIYNKWNLISQEVSLNYTDSLRLKETML